MPPANEMSIQGYSRTWPRTDEAASPLRGRHLATAEDVSVAVDGNPSISREGPADADVAASVAEAYRRYGRDALGRISGNFAVAIVDHRKDAVLLAIDRMGIEQMSFCASGGGLAFDSSLRGLARRVGTTKLRAQSLFDYLLLHVVPAPATAFEGLEKLRPGTYVWFEKGRVNVDRYWRPEFFEGRADFAELKAELRGRLEGAVRACAPDDATGAFLSGGLDSSSVAGMLSKVRRAPSSFSIAFGVESYNEIEYARIASRHFGLKSYEYDVTPSDIVAAIPQLAAAFDEPFGNSSAVPTLFCARLAAENGVRHLLAGDGGDEIFGGNERYVRQKVFERYFLLPRFLRAGLIEPAARRIAANSAVMPLRKLRSYIDQASIPLPERLETWNYAYRADLRSMLEPDFLAAIDARAPLREMTETYAASGPCSLLNRMLHYDWYYTLAYNDLRKVGTACDLAGVRVSYPMLDTAMIDLSLRVPTAMKIEGSELRSFYKRAMADFLPSEILTKPKHGFGLPFGQWLKTHGPLAELVYGHLTNLKRRGIVRSQFIDDLVASHKTGHASFFGYPIWDLVMLEAWLDRHATPYGTTQRMS